MFRNPEEGERPPLEAGCQKTASENVTVDTNVCNSEL
jgi:hypothetical protein